MINQNKKILNETSNLLTLYKSNKIDAKEFSKKMSEFFTDDFHFWCNYNPSSKKLTPLFQERNGISGLLDRYYYEAKHEKVLSGTTQPYDLVLEGDTAYFSMDEIATFFDGPEVTFKIIFKFLFRDNKLCKIEMFLEQDKIESKYSNF